MTPQSHEIWGTDSDLPIEPLVVQDLGLGYRGYNGEKVGHDVSISQLQIWRLVGW